MALGVAAFFAGVFLAGVFLVALLGVLGLAALLGVLGLAALLGVAAFLAGVFLAEPTFLVATVFFTCGEQAACSQHQQQQG